MNQRRVKRSIKGSGVDAAYSLLSNAWAKTKGLAEADEPREMLQALAGISASVKTYDNYIKQLERASTRPLNRCLLGSDIRNSLLKIATTLGQTDFYVPEESRYLQNYVKNFNSKFSKRVFEIRAELNKMFPER